jgi:hypothetical protein
MRNLFGGNIRKKVALALAAAVVAAGGAVAFAYFTATGTGTGNGTVGTATNFTVTVAAPSGGLLYPGSGTDTLTYTVTNPGAGYENLDTTTAALTTDGPGGVYNTVAYAGPGTPVPVGFVDGCQAEWFTVTNSSPNLPDDLAGDTSYADGSATLVLNDSGTNQDACENVTPQLTVTAS